MSDKADVRSKLLSENAPEHSEGYLELIISILESLSNYIWPILIGFLFIIFRKKISEIITAISRRIDAATEIEIGGIKIKGPVLSQKGEVIRGDSSKVKIENAKESDFSRRKEIYEKSRCLMLVHTIRPELDGNVVDGYRIFDVSVYIASHRNFGKLNDIKRVSYYFGDKWGSSKFGSKYILENSNNNFALTAQMWGACVCVAEIEFHGFDEKITICRYLDVEMAPIYGIALEDAREGSP